MLIGGRGLTIQHPTEELNEFNKEDGPYIGGVVQMGFNDKYKTG